ncbi:MAG: efflux RND transporter periplasmic adaptor subunit [Granulosicoccus sp.]
MSTKSMKNIRSSLECVCRVGLFCLLPSVAWSDNAPETHECLIEPMVVADVGSPVQGVLRELLVDRSALVSKGQAIAELESDVDIASVEYARSRARMQSEISAREADLELAKHNLKRQKSLFSQQLIPAQKRDEALARKQVASAALVQALENFQLLQLELQRAERMLAQRTLRSPVDGVVVEHLAFPGEFIYDNPVMTVAQLDPLRVEVVLPARLFGQFKPGDSARILPEIESGEPMIAEVDVVDRLLDTRSGTFGVRLLLTNPDLQIPGGQKCQLEFLSELSSAE